MDKNSIIAIVLSTLVLGGSLFYQTKYVLPKQKAQAEAQKQAQAVAKSEIVEESTEKDSLVSIGKTSDNIPEENFVIETKKAKVTFTNKGGDIVSYKIFNTKENETEEIEMVTNVSEVNRAFALSLGNADNSIINEKFNVIKIDDYTIGFVKEFSRKDAEGNVKNFQVAKRYSFKEDDYLFKLDVSIDNGESGDGFNINDAAYTLRTAPQIGPKINAKDKTDIRQYVSCNGTKKYRKPISDKVFNKNFTWAGVTGKYFSTLVYPVNANSMNQMVKSSTKNYGQSGNAQIYLTRKAFETNSVTDTYYVYIGPRHEKELIAYNNSEKNSWGLSGLNLNQAQQTSSLLWPIEIALKWILEMLYKLAKNWGVAIILLTILIKIVLFPLNLKTATGSIKMQEIQPKVKNLQEKYKDNPTKLNEETMKLYKQVGYNPASGCLPMIIQMLIIFALYSVFNNYYEFRGASFIKGWIDDLSIGDSIWSWEKKIPIISGFTQNNLRILPLVYTFSQLFNGKITQYGGQTGGNQMQMNMMMYGMPIMFFFLFYNMASGLLLYWAVSNIIQIVQQLVINGIVKNKKAKLAANELKVNANELKFKGGKKKTR